MGRSPCCEKVGLKKGPWTPDEDHKLLAYIHKYGHGSWRALPAKAGLQRCGKSCRLRWTNYLRPDIKRGKFSLQEEQTIIQLHALLGNRWSAIAAYLAKRTDNEIKNYWNTHLKKRLSKMGIDPMTHKPKINPLGSNLSHMAQWETARLEAEARLVRRSNYTTTSSLLSSPLPHHFNLNKPPPRVPPPLDVLKAWQETWTNKPSRVFADGQGQSYHFISPVDENDMFASSSSVATQSMTTYGALNFSDQNLLAFPTVGFGNDNLSYLENPYDSYDSYDCTLENPKTTVGDIIMQLNDNNVEYPNGSGPVTDPLSGLPSFINGLTELLPENMSGHSSTGFLDDVVGNCGMAADTEENKSSYWNSILNNLVAVSPVGSPVSNFVPQLFKLQI